MTQPFISIIKNKLKRNVKKKKNIFKMNFQEYLDQNKEIQSNILNYIENDENCDQNFQNLTSFYEAVIRRNYDIIKLFFK